MKGTFIAFLRALILLILGGLLIAFPEDASTNITSILVIIIGVLFLLPGAVTLIASLRGFVSKQSRVLMVILSVGSLLLGAILVCFPHLFIRPLMYFIAFLICLMSIILFIKNIQFYKHTNVHAFFWIMPILLIGVSVFVCWKNPASPFLWLAITSICYALVQILHIFAYRKTYNALAYEAMQKKEEKQLDVTTPPELPSVEDVANAEETVSYEEVSSDEP